MAGPLLEAKFHQPSRRRSLVPRVRLHARLDAGLASALTLVSAPAGFGKTTAVAEWLDGRAEDGTVTAWLSLDELDQDPSSFWAYVVAALDRVAPGVGTAAATLLGSTPSPIEPVLVLLLNDLEALAHDVVLVLDDFHVVGGDAVEGVTFLLEHLPPTVHLVVASRTDPSLPLARLRARGDLVEVRAADLRFTPDEAADYLNGAMGLTLAAADVATLEDRTEGWIAALQLAALSMRGRDDVAAFIASFAGDDRYIVDYLVGEVLERQPAPVRDFLLQTSMLRHLTGPLCRAVTGQEGGSATLAALERENLFLVPLDDRRHAYRYHHLFADVLRARLLDEQPDRVPELHRRASAWFEQDGDLTEAISHALAGADVDHAADLVELAMPAMRQERREVTLGTWLRQLPSEVFETRPVLTVARAASLMGSGQDDRVEALLRAAEQRLEGAGPNDGSTVVVDEEAGRRLPGAIALYRAALARTAGDGTAAIDRARHALDVVDGDDHLGRGAASGLLALALWTSGDLEAAHHWWSESIASLRRAGHVADSLGCSIGLADIRITQGRLGDAQRTYEQGLALGTEPVGRGEPALRGTADMHVGLAEVLTERNELDAARRHLDAARDLGDAAGLPQNPYRWCVAMARLASAAGDLGEALDLLADAERLYDGDFFPDVRPIGALWARSWIAQGEPERALRWAGERHLSVDDDLTFLREFEHITFARARLAAAPADRDDEVRRFLDRLLAAAEVGQRTARVIELLVLQALAQEGAGDPSAARAALERALTLAEPEGQARVFLDEGPRVVALLGAVPSGGAASAHAERLVALAAAPPPPKHRRTELVDPLSARELEVLHLLGTELSGPEIARELVVSLHTVRSHTKTIYSKLGVTNRRAAVRRGIELAL